MQIYILAKDVNINSPPNQEQSLRSIFEKKSSYKWEPNTQYLVPIWNSSCLLDYSIEPYMQGSFLGGFLEDVSRID